MPAKIPLKKLAAFVDDMRDALGLPVTKARLKYIGAFDIDKEGKWRLGGKVDAADVMTLVGGVPVSVEGGVEKASESQGSADLELEIEFG